MFLLLFIITKDNIIPFLEANWLFRLHFYCVLLLYHRRADDVKMVQNGVVPTKKIGRILFSKSCKVADGSNGAQIYVGVVDNIVPAAIKRIGKDTTSSELSLNKLVVKGHSQHTYCMFYMQKMMTLDTLQLLSVRAI